MEGATDIEFYDLVLDEVKASIAGNTFPVKAVKKYNMKGIGNYKRDAIRKFIRYKDEIMAQDRAMKKN